MAAWDNFTNQKQWEFYLKHLIRTNELALLKSIVLIYDNQTEEEKLIGVSAGENKIGFNRWDAEEMTHIARKIKRGIPLKQNEIIHAKLTMPKYWKQLMVISKQKLKEKQEYDRIQAELKEIKEKKEALEEYMLEDFHRCMEEGKSCTYGICSECPGCYIK